MNNKSFNVKRLTGLALLTALIIVLQTLLGGIQIGPFTITLTMIPIVIGGVLYGPAAGAILGLVFGIVVCWQVVTGAAGVGSTMMLETNAPATMIICILKGTAAGFLAACASRAFDNRNLRAGVLAASVTGPVVNTGIFCVGLVTVFGELARSWALGAGQSSLAIYILTGIIGVNFLIELAADIVIAPIAVRIIKAVRRDVQ